MWAARLAALASGILWASSGYRHGLNGVLFTLETEIPDAMSFRKN
jgi:hypothetical protein